jgi:hypothetical protein
VAGPWRWEPNGLDRPQGVTSVTPSVRDSLAECCLGLPIPFRDAPLQIENGYDRNQAKNNRSDQEPEEPLVQ